MNPVKTEWVAREAVEQVRAEGLERVAGQRRRHLRVAHVRASLGGAGGGRLQKCHCKYAVVRRSGQGWIHRWSAMRYVLHLRHQNSVAKNEKRHCDHNAHSRLDSEIRGPTFFSSFSIIWTEIGGDGGGVFRPSTSSAVSAKLPSAVTSAVAVRDHHARTPQHQLHRDEGGKRIKISSEKRA